MICGECAWEADLRRELAEKGVDFEAYVNRPSMKNRGHKACRGGTWCACQHRVTARRDVPRMADGEYILTGPDVRRLARHD